MSDPEKRSNFDEQKYLIAIIRILNAKGYSDIADGLYGAYCSVFVTALKNDPKLYKYLIIYFFVHIDLIVNFDDKRKDILKEVADIAVPKDLGMSVLKIEVSPNYEMISETKSEIERPKMKISAFGPVLEGSQYECDIFIIMPFDTSFKPIFDRLISPVAKELSLSIKRGDDPFSNKRIMDDVWSMLHICKLIIADLTGRNANVFYELGVAHSIDKPVIMITQDKIEKLPFDIRDHRAIHYDKAFDKVDIFKSELHDAIQKILGLTDGNHFRT